MSAYLLPQNHRSTRFGGDKWRPEEDIKLLELTGKVTKWSSVSAELPRRSEHACRMRYRFISKRILGDPKTEEVATHYIRYGLFKVFSTEILTYLHSSKVEMWESIAKELGLPWHTVERIYAKIVTERPKFLYYETNRHETSTGMGSSQLQKAIVEGGLNPAIGDTPQEH